MHVIRDIDGVNIARGTADADSISLVIMAPSGFSNENNTYYPAESLRCQTLEGIAALRQLCDELIEEHMELGQRG